MKIEADRHCYNSHVKLEKITTNKYKEHTLIIEIIHVSYPMQKLCQENSTVLFQKQIKSIL